MTDPIIEHLLQSKEPSICYMVHRDLLKEDPASPAMRGLQADIRNSERVNTLLSGRNGEGQIPLPVYKKWQGAHWVLAMLAELGYPSGDSSLEPLATQVTDWLTSKQRTAWIIKRTQAAGGSPTRVCGSIEGNALLALLKLGIGQNHVDQLAENLLKWQWPDGGWNCDQSPLAKNSSFMETLIPMRALGLYGILGGNTQARRAVEQAAGVFLKRSLYKSLHNGKVINPNFIKLHYPCYWHYDILFGLKVMQEVGCLDDPRCREAKQILAEKQSKDGGWQSEGKYYHTDQKKSGFSLVDWGPVSKTRINPWVTLDALRVLYPDTPKEVLA